MCIYCLLKNNYKTLKINLNQMKNVLFATVIVLSTILTSCGTSAKTEEVKTTEDSTKFEVKAETTSVTTPSVDSAKVEKK
jgi:hypothetical protein